MDKRRWYQMRAFCEDCNWSIRVDRREFASDFYDYCPKCGSEKPHFTDRVVRWWSHTVWYKPTTWFTGKWVNAYGDVFDDIE